MRHVALRSRLLLLAVAAILPAAIASGVALLALVQQQRAQTERAGIEITRALATAVDAELRRVISVLEVLATSVPLDRGDAAGFYLRAQRVLATREHWLGINLATPAADMLVNTSFPFGASLP